jgi:hypothetical protein
MKKKLSVIIAFALTIAAAVFYGHTTKSDRIYDNNINNVSYGNIGVLTEGSVLSQRFICRKDAIDGFLVKTGISGDCSSCVVHLEVKDAGSGQIILSYDENGSTFRPRKIHYFRTGKLNGMKDKDLIISLSQTGSDASNGVTFSYAKETDARYFADLDGTALDGVLPLGTAADGFDPETFIIFLLSVWFIWGFMWFLYKLFQ